MSAFFFDRRQHSFVAIKTFNLQLQYHLWKESESIYLFGTFREIKNSIYNWQNPYLRKKE